MKPCLEVVFVKPDNVTGSQFYCLLQDLAARNVLLTRMEVCKIADFGLSRKLGDDDDIYVSRVRDADHVDYTDYVDHVDYNLQEVSLEFPTDRNVPHFIQSFFIEFMFFIEFIKVTNKYIRSSKSFLTN